MYMEKDQDYQIIDSVWFDKVGIVKISNKYQHKWYIGVGKGKNQKLDEEYVAKRGCPIDINSLAYFFNNPTI